MHGFFIRHQDFTGEVKKIAEFLGISLSDEQIEKVAHFSTMDEMRTMYEKHVKDQLKYLNKGNCLYFNLYTDFIQITILVI